MIPRTRPLPGAFLLALLVAFPARAQLPARGAVVPSEGGAVGLLPATADADRANALEAAGARRFYLVPVDVPGSRPTRAGLLARLIARRHGAPVAVPGEILGGEAGVVFAPGWTTLEAPAAAEVLVAGEEALARFRAEARARERARERHARRQREESMRKAASRGGLLELLGTRGDLEGLFGATVGAVSPSIIGDLKMGSGGSGLAPNRSAAPGLGQLGSPRTPAAAPAPAFGGIMPEAGRIPLEDPDDPYDPTNPDSGQGTTGYSSGP